MIDKIIREIVQIKISHRKLIMITQIDAKHRWDLIYERLYHSKINSFHFNKRIEKCS